jgi:hypothetical protein
LKAERNRGRSAVGASSYDDVATWRYMTHGAGYTADDGNAAYEIAQADKDRFET